MITPEASAVVQAFQAGRGVEVALVPGETAAMHRNLGIVGIHLDQLPVGASFAWAGDQPTRQAFWVVSEGYRADEPFMTDPDRLAEFDHDAEGGQRGLAALSELAVRQSLLYLKGVADAAIRLTASAIGIPEELQQTARSSGPNLLQPQPDLQ